MGVAGKPSAHAVNTDAWMKRTLERF